MRELSLGTQNWSRRAVHGSLRLAGLAGATIAPALANGGANVPPLRGESPQVQLEVLVRLHGNLKGVQTPRWYTGYIYGMRSGEAPSKLESVDIRC